MVGREREKRNKRRERELRKGRNEPLENGLCLRQTKDKTPKSVVLFLHLCKAAPLTSPSKTFIETGADPRSILPSRLSRETQAAREEKVLVKGQPGKKTGAEQKEVSDAGGI